MELGFAFILKKIIAFMLYPLSIGMFLFLLAFLLFLKKRARTATLFFIFAFVWITVVSSPFISNRLLAGLESKYKRVETIPKNVTYILLLGGDRQKRAWEALRLYREIPNAKIITSGYTVSGELTDAQKAAALLEDVGVKKEDILSQGEVKDTIEEARAIKKRLGKEPFFLVTSAYHMPRAMQIFKAAKLNAIAAPTDFNDPSDGGVVNIFSARELDKTEKALHEYFGLLWLKVKGTSY